MKLKLSEWASIAEIVSGLAVVITLIVLVLGIRENTEVTRASAFDRNMESVNQFRMEIAKDPELTRLWYSQFNLPGLLEGGDAQSQTAEGRRVMLAQVFWGILEKTYYAYQYGLIGDDEWVRFGVGICAARTGPEWEDWQRTVQFVLSPRFIEFVEECSDRR